jgi:hypothetical protein
LLVVPNEDNLLEIVLEPVDDREVVADIYLGCFVDDQVLHRGNTGNISHLGIEEVAQRREDNTRSEKKPLGCKDIVRKGISSNEVGLYLLVEVLVPARID